MSLREAADHNCLFVFTQAAASFTTSVLCVNKSFFFLFFLAQLTLQVGFLETVCPRVEYQTNAPLKLVLVLQNQCDSRVQEPRGPSPYLAQGDIKLCRSCCDIKAQM